MRSWRIGAAASAMALATTLVAPLLSSCRNGRSAPTDAPTQSVAAQPAVVLHAGTRAIPIRVELAKTEGERERGLMFRNHLDPETGMLFLFPRPAPLTFWMKNTFIPLDMLFIDPNRRVVGIVENAVPETESPRRVDGDSQFVLEIAGGLSRRLGISAGSEVEFRGVPLAEIRN